MIHWTWLLTAWILGPAIGWALCCLFTVGSRADKWQTVGDDSVRPDHIDGNPIGI